MAASVPRTGATHPAGRLAATSAWGDGFASDSLRDMARVRHWDELHPDEHAFLHPALLPMHGEIPEPVVRRLTSAVAVRTWRHSVLAGVPVQRRATPLAEHWDWYAPSLIPLVAWRRLGWGQASPARLARDAYVLDHLSGVLRDIRCSKPTFTRHSEAVVAFGAGFHPGYIWGESAMAPERGLVAAWLGHVDRGRKAYMPPAVAESLADIHYAGRDADIVAMCGGMRGLQRFARAAQARLAGRDAAFSFPFALARRSSSDKSKASFRGI